MAKMLASHTSDSLIPGYPKSGSEIPYTKTNESIFETLLLESTPNQYKNSVSETFIRTDLYSKTRGDKRVVDDNSLQKHTQSLINLIYNEEVEVGYSTQAESYIEELVTNNKLVAMNWLSDIFLKYYGEERVLIGILHAISHIEYQAVYPQGQHIAMSGTCHRDIVVRDYAIKAFENWGNTDSLQILKNIKYPETWLQRYVDKIILELEEELF